MGGIHLVLGIAAAASIVFGVAWAIWPVPDTDPEAERFLRFPYLVPGAIMSAAGLGVAIWAINGIRRDRAGAFGPPPR